MISKKIRLSNFSRALASMSDCFRPDNEAQIVKILTMYAKNGVLARGNASSYSDCCLNDQGLVIDTSRLNHLLSFDETTGILICQGSVSFADLFLIHPDFIPPVIPGTLKATVAGGIANDIHGKNNHQQGCFGDHVQWLDLALGNQSYRCDRETNSELFFATIAGLGLTGFIKLIAIKLRKASSFVTTHSEQYYAWEPLVERMQTKGCDYDYQVAWLDLLNEPRALLSFANHCEGWEIKEKKTHTIPKLPLRLINSWSMKQFNSLFFNYKPRSEQIMSLPQFNNPLDSILQWNRLYGKNGLLQFQAVFAQQTALSTIEQLILIIREKKATPTLAVLKYFTKKGSGLLSFAQPGFTLAIDFINNYSARQAIKAMNEWISQTGGKIYLAKDLYLNKEQFRQQYDNNDEFSKLLKKYQPKMCSNLSKRLGINL
ncbi:MAG: FAD-dependent oxidoreductase [Tatlockia sp.]|nr:FAD-dependent oxidoreductase [Tatlockia sp.]